MLLEVRKSTEHELGSSEGAVPVPMKHFRDFQEISKEFPAEWKKKKVITFCTGGIRCEKAARFLKEQGYENIYQLHGGILAYLKEFGSAHFRGSCFVFDHRVSLDPQLRPVDELECKNCGKTFERDFEKDSGLRQFCMECFEQEEQLSAPAKSASPSRS